MRIATTLAPILLLLPLSLWGQAQPASGTGHFEAWLSGVHWGGDEQTFDVKFGARRVEATFTVAKNGFGWHRAFTSSREIFSAWEDVKAWCWAPGRVLFRTQQHSSTRSGGVYDVELEDLVTIVDGYFRKYVPDLEWNRPEWACTFAGLNRPNPAAMSEIIELLEAASSQEP